MLRLIRLIVLTVVAISFVQCSGSIFEEDVFSDPRDGGNPNRPPDSGTPPTDKPKPSPYVDEANAKLVINSIDTFSWDSTMNYLDDWILGKIPYEDSWDNPGSSNTTYIQLDLENGKVFLREPEYWHYTIMGVVGAQEWIISFDILEDRISMEAITYAPIARACSSTTPDMTNTSGKLTIEGKWREARNGWDGTYVWEQQSSIHGCAASCSGTLTILLIDPNILLE